MKHLLIIFSGTLLIALALVLLTGSVYIDRAANKIATHTSVPVSSSTLAFHKTLFIADLHNDALLWNRDLLKRNNHGHTDIPRLLEGNVGLQVFTIVSKTPWDQDVEKDHSDTSDSLGLLAVVGGWPIKTWGSLKERTLYQAARLHHFAERSEGRLRIITSAAQLREYRSQQRPSDQTAGILGIEGAHALEGDIENVEVFFNAGIRLIGIAHLFDNEFGGSEHGIRKIGLTEKGKELIQRMQQKGMIIDVTHASSSTMHDVLALATKPVIASHTGVRGTCDNVRNLTDEEIKDIARTGGVIGIGYWKRAVCERSPQAIARAIRYTATLVGADHVALGSDFDGNVTVPFDVTGLAQITEALRQEHFTDAEIRKIMGENVSRVFSEILPER